MYLEDGMEKEFFEDEAKEIVLDVLQQYIQEHPNEIRRTDILSSIITANKRSANKAAGRRNQTKDVLRGYSTMNSSMEGILKDLGCSIVTGKKHYKIRYYGDDRYQTTMSKTGSDSRSGLNLASIITKIMM